MGSPLSPRPGQCPGFPPPELYRRVAYMPARARTLVRQACRGQRGEGMMMLPQLSRPGPECSHSIVHGLVHRWGTAHYTYREKGRDRERREDGTNRLNKTLQFRMCENPWRVTKYMYTLGVKLEYLSILGNFLLNQSQTNSCIPFFGLCAV